MKYLLLPFLLMVSFLSCASDTTEYSFGYLLENKSYTRSYEHMINSQELYERSTMDTASNNSEGKTPLSDTLVILEKLDDFYSSSFSSLMVLIAGMMGIIGILVPIVISIYQSKKIDGQKENLEIFIKNELVFAVSELKNELDESNGIKMDEYKKEIEDSLAEQTRAQENKIIRIGAKSLGSVFHVQGSIKLKDKNYFLATNSFIEAAINYITARDENNLCRVINMCHQRTIPNVTQQDECEKLEKKIHLLIEKMKKINSNGRYTDEIQKIQDALSKVKKNIANKKLPEV
ncbi:hypothetical protein ABF227_003550 [Yersinia ruckeri]|nr:hypothetical protein [Yersinia ruckeri]EKN4693352.1 hypothetical protein [Yersinia ruckeri]